MTSNIFQKKNLVPYTFYLLVFVMGMWGSQLLIDKFTNNAEGSKAAQAMVERPAPEFSLPDISGKIRNSHEWDNKVVVLNFWATWCPPCRRETPMFVELQEKYSAAGLQFVGIAIDTVDQVQDFIDTYGVNYPILVGEDDAIAIGTDYGNRYSALPYTVIIDRQQKIRFVQRGEIEREVIENTIANLL